jgi:hypothetical protein
MPNEGRMEMRSGMWVPVRASRRARAHVRRWYSGTRMATGHRAERLMDAHNEGGHYFRRVAACPFCRRYATASSWSYSEFPGGR